MILQCVNFIQKVDSQGQIIKSFTRIDTLAIVQKDVFLKLILNIHLFAPDKIDVKREIPSEYQLKIADLYNIVIGNVRQISV